MVSLYLKYEIKDVLLKELKTYLLREESLNKLLFDESSNYIFDKIYMPAAQTDSLGSFNTTVDIKLKQWAEKQLPQKCVEVNQKLINQVQLTIKYFILKGWN